MFKPKRLLKVISVIMIIFGVLGGVFSIFTYAMLPQLGDMAGLDMSVYESVFTPLNIAISIVSTISCIMAGVFGVSGKSLRWAMIFGGIYTLIVIYNVVTTVIAGGVLYTLILSVLIPILYWWGIYQSKE